MFPGSVVIVIQRSPGHRSAGGGRTARPYTTHRPRIACSLDPLTLSRTLALSWTEEGLSGGDWAGMSLCLAGDSNDPPVHRQARRDRPPSLTVRPGWSPVGAGELSVLPRYLCSRRAVWTVTCKQLSVCPRVSWRISFHQVGAISAADPTVGPAIPPSGLTLDHRASIRQSSLKAAW
jgi:hypothetical protein